MSTKTINDPDLSVGNPDRVRSEYVGSISEMMLRLDELRGSGLTVVGTETVDDAKLYGPDGEALVASGIRIDVLEESAEHRIKAGDA